MPTNPNYGESILKKAFLPWLAGELLRAKTESIIDRAIQRGTEDAELEEILKRAPLPTKHELLTQSYSTWGDKLLQHCDVLAEIQQLRHFSPITLQFAPTEICDSHCSFCSVEDRPFHTSIKGTDAIQVIDDFADLGIKSIEFTGGGNPMLWHDGRLTINSLIRHAESLDLKVGIITNSHDLARLDPAVYEMVDWIRISLAKLDEGKTPADYDLDEFPEDKVGWSYIIHEKTTPSTIQQLREVLNRFPDSKFMRIAGNCLEMGANERVRQDWRPIIDAVDTFGKMFVKDIGTDEKPFDAGCYVGMLRPYVAASPEGDEYLVYTCTSHVLEKRTYDRAYALCSIKDIIPAWNAMNGRFAKEGIPYEVNGNKGRGWGSTCNRCYYGPNNRLLHAVATKLPDADFA